MESGFCVHGLGGVLFIVKGFLGSPLKIYEFDAGNMDLR